MSCYVSKLDFVAVAVAVCVVVVAVAVFVAVVMAVSVVAAVRNPPPVIRYFAFFCDF